MLRKLTVAIALAGFMAGLAHAGGLPQTGINGSMHDMNAIAGTTHDVAGRTCVFCHTPHNAQPTNSSVDTKAPLWNRADTTWNSSPYGWAAPANLSKDGLTASIPFNDDPLVGPTRLCMSCHDGSVAIDSHASNGAPGGSLLMGSSNHAYVNDLTITHPIGFKYSDAVAARNTGSTKELITADQKFISVASPALAAANFNTSSRGDMGSTGAKIQDTLYGAAGYMTCATCHEVHNTTNVKSDTGKSYNYFLRARQEGSAICLSCHIK